jgi:hypothetical protein
MRVKSARKQAWKRDFLADNRRHRPAIKALFKIAAVHPEFSGARGMHAGIGVGTTLVGIPRSAVSDTSLSAPAGCWPNK